MDNSGFVSPQSDVLWGGLSKRELFAAMAMQGLCAHCGSYGLYNGPDEIAKRGAEIADALLAELVKEPSNG